MKPQETERNAMSKKPKESWLDSKIHIVTGVVVLAVIAAVVVVVLTGKPGSTDANSTQSGAFDNVNIDYSSTFPSWNHESKALSELVQYVAQATDESNENYVKPEDRIATFDMDGTILCEKAPVYVDYCLTMHRVLDDPSYEADEESHDAMEQIRDYAYTYGGTNPEQDPDKARLVASAFAGMTPEEFRSYVVNFADSTQAVGFEGMTYGQSFYKPMLEVIEYLRANDFDVWMVSACEREVVRALVDRLHIPLDHVIATDVQFNATNQGEEAAADHTMGQDEKIVLGEPLLDETAKTGKCIAIAREIGKYPVLAFGNSSGDYAMLNYAESNPHYKGMGMLVVADDTEREYGDTAKAEGIYQIVATENWTGISMKNDWSTIYGEGVKKTQLPRANEAAQEESSSESESDESSEEASQGEEGEYAEAA